MDENQLVKQIIISIFLKRYTLGYNDISLKMDDILEYVPKLEKLFEEENLTSDVFIKTPVSETYDEFKSFLISQILGLGLGYMNPEYNKIILSVNDYLVNKKIKEMTEYKEIIDKGCSLLSEEDLETLEPVVKKIGVQEDKTK